MTDLIQTAAPVAKPSFLQIKLGLRVTPDEPSILWTHSVPTAEDRKVLAGDLARKHGLSVDRAEMLIDRFGSNRQALEGAAQALRARLD